MFMENSNRLNDFTKNLKTNILSIMCITSIGGRDVGGEHEETLIRNF